MLQRVPISVARVLLLQIWLGSCGPLSKKFLEHTRAREQPRVVLDLRRVRRLENNLTAASHGTPMYADWRAQVVEAHNMYRCMHGVAPVVWNDEIEAHAKQWVAQGHGQRSPPFLLTHVAGFENVGENIAWGVTDEGGSKSAGGAVQIWYDQIKNTDGGRGLLSQASDQTSKYSQLVWASSTALGCALHNEALVCQYGPAGNVPGEFGAQVEAQTRTEQSCRPR